MGEAAESAIGRGAAARRGVMLLNVTFQANGKTYVTDEETRNLMGEFRDGGNEEMVAFVFHAGIAAGRIFETDVERAFQDWREKYAAWREARGPWKNPEPRPYHEYEGEHQAAHAAWCVWRSLNSAQEEGRDGSL